MVQNGTFRGVVSGTIRGARTVRINPTGSDTYEIVLEIDREMISHLMNKPAHRLARRKDNGKARPNSPENQRPGHSASRGPCVVLLMMFVLFGGLQALASGFEFVQTTGRAVCIRMPVRDDGREDVL